MNSKRLVRILVIALSLSVFAPFTNTSANIREQLAREGIKISEADNYAASQIAGAGNGRFNLCLDRLTPVAQAAGDAYRTFRNSLSNSDAVLADDPNHPLGAALKNWETIKSRMYSENGE